MPLLKLALLLLALLLHGATVPGGARTLNSDFVFPDVGSDRPVEGDECSLPGTPLRTGICKSSLECPQAVRNNPVYCASIVKNLVVCCPSPGNKQQSPASVTNSGNRNSNRIKAGLAKQECETLESRSTKLINHISGNRMEAALGEFPFMALVYYGDGEAANVLCGASLISKRFLLTAAHCFKGYQPVSVRLGAVNNNDADAFEYRVKQVHVHENHKPRRNDIALLELHEDVAFDSYISPICLNSDQLDIDASHNLTVMGWGADGDGKRGTKLYKAQVNSMPLEPCNAVLNATARITVGEGNLCALGEKLAGTGEYTDTCEGDSGGPMIASIEETKKFYLVGVVSFGVTCGGPTPGIYSRVSHYIDWIEQRVWAQQ